MSSPWPFLGRDTEFRRVTSLLEAGTGVLLFGEPGVGKSALARQVRRTLVDGRVGLVAGHAVSDRTPFEAFAGVLTGRADAGYEPQLLRPAVVAERVAAWIGASDGGRSVLIVDDIHLLDPRSAQVVLQLAMDATVTVIGTAPGASSLPPTVGRLWREGLCECVELSPMSDDVVESVLESVLDGPVDADAVRAFRTRARGNPLLLRELVTAAVNGGGIRQCGRTWTLTGTLMLSSSLRALVADRLAGVAGDQRAALDKIAAAEPLPLAAAEQLVGGEQLDRLEAARLIAVRDELAGPVITCAHPLYGDVLRDELPPLRRHRLRLAAAQALEAGCAPTGHDLVRAALWRLDAGQPDTPERLLSAAQAACSLSLDTAERLARAAHDRDASPRTTVQLARILTHRNHAAEAAELIAALPPESLTDADRDAIAYCDGLGRGLLTGDTETGTALVAAALAGSSDATDLLRALHSALLAFDARFVDSLEAGTPITDDPSVAASARALSALGVVGSEYWLGRTRRALAAAARVPYDDEECRESLPFAGPAIELVAVCALIEQGLLAEAEDRAERMRDRADAAGDPFAGPRARYCQGRVALARGRCRTALELFRRCQDTVTPFDRMSLRHIAAMAARAAAELGDLPSAAAALDVPDAPILKAYEQERILAEAAVQAAGLHMAEAADRAAWAGGVAASLGQWGVAAAGYHDAARYGIARAVLGPLQDAAGHVDGELAGCYVQHALALAAEDGPELSQVARRFERLGLIRYAAEAAAEAALAHAAADESRPARANGILAQTLFARCEGAVSPWLAGATTGVALTNRERQVIALAVAGRHDTSIASHLGISTRTVQTHLAHAYAKLGITGRHQLPHDALAAPEVGASA